MNTVILRVKPNSRFHFGRVALDTNTGLLDTSEIIHSDLLYGALISNLAQIGNKEQLEKLITAFKNNDIVLSSGFYCIEKAKNDFTYLLPRPVHSQNYIEEYENIKKIGSVKFVSLDVLKTHPKYWIVNKKSKVLLSNDETKLLGKDLELYSTEVVTNVNVHPTNKKSSVFNTAFIQIADIEKKENSLYPQVHFYFLYEYSVMCNAEIKEVFQFSVKLIERNGLGGERSSGCGFIENVDFEQTFNEPKIDAPVQQISLGLFIPTEDEFKWFKYYNYITRGGRRTAKGGELSRVRMLAEGAIIKAGTQPKGTWKNLNNDDNDDNEPFLRFGKSLTIQIPDYDSNR